MDSADDVILAVEQAFAHVTLGKVTLHEAMVIDAYGDERRRRKARKLDPERDWRDVPASAIEECYSAISFLDPKSWRFYLPAYIRCGLRRMDASIDEVIYALSPGSSEAAEAYALVRFQTLDRAQIAAVRRFLEFASENDTDCDGGTASRALEDYWSRAADG